MRNRAKAVSSLPLTWDEIRARYPDQWVLLVDLDWIDEDGAFRTAVVLAHGRDRDETLRRTDPLRAGYREFAHSYTGRSRTPPRALTHARQMQLRHQAAWYVHPDGRLDLLALMQAFQQFWRKDGHLAAEGFLYREAGPHLLLMAFLQRIVNGGGRVEREYGLGRGALDLMVVWGPERHAIEVKLRRDTETEEDALGQVAGYLDSAGLDEGGLVRFDLRREIPWPEKLVIGAREHAGKRVQVVGC